VVVSFLAFLSLSFLVSGFTWKIIYPVFLIGLGYFRFMGKEKPAGKEGKEGKEVSAYS
jgi:predicted DNA repair protein MutK